MAQDLPGINKRNKKMQDKPLTERQHYWLEHIEPRNKSGKKMTEYAGEQDTPVRAMCTVVTSLLSLIVASIYATSQLYSLPSQLSVSIAAH